MSERAEIRYITEEEYLKAEAASAVKHEYVDGCVFAMAGATQAHNRICTNLVSAIHGQLGDGPCCVYSSDMKVRIESAKSFYYPDVVVTCEPFDAASVIINSPVLIVEVLSPTTASTDRREKLVAYRKIASLRQYVIVFQDRKRVEVFSKGANQEWDFCSVTGEQPLLLSSLPNGDLSLSLDSVYKGYDPPARVKEEEGSYEFDMVYRG